MNKVTQTQAPEQLSPEVKRMMKYIEGKSFETILSINYVESSEIKLEVTYIMERDFDESDFQKFSEILSERGYKQTSKPMDTDFPVTQEQWNISHTFDSLELFNSSMYAEEYGISLTSVGTRLDRSRIIDAILSFDVAELAFRKNTAVELRGAKKFVIMKNFNLQNDIHNGENFISYKYDRPTNSASAFFEAREYKDDTKLPVETVSALVLAAALGLTSLGILVFLKKHPELAKQIRDNISKTSIPVMPSIPKKPEFIHELQKRLSQTPRPVIKMDIPPVERFLHK